MARAMLSAFADEYADDFNEQLAALNRFGIEYLELRHADGKNVARLSAAEVLEVQRQLCAHGIKVSAIGSPLGKIAIDGDIDAHIELTKRVCETAARLKSRYVRVFSFYLPQGQTREDCRAAVLDALSRMLDVADEYGVVLCHENEARIWGESPQQCRELLDLLGGRMRAVFDMGNFVLGGYPPYPDAYRLLLPYVEYFHIKDALYCGAIVPPGKGEARIGEILRDFACTADKDFFVTLEPHLETFSGLNALTDVAFDNPYKYKDQQTAFTDAVTKLRQVIGEPK